MNFEYKHKVQLSELNLLARQGWKLAGTYQEDGKTYCIVEREIKMRSVPLECETPMFSVEITPGVRMRIR